MRRQFVMVLMIVVVSCMSLTGCNTSSSDKDRFIGSWKGTYSWAGNLSRRAPATITFFSNGTYSATLPLIHDIGTWEVSDGTLTKTADGNPAVIYSYSFSNGDTSLLFTSPSENDQWNITRQ